jgi:hypothetical protein
MQSISAGLPASKPRMLSTAQGLLLCALAVGGFIYFVGIRQSLPYTNETDEPTRTLHELTRAAVEEGRVLDHIEVRRPTLEDVYLELVGEGGGDREEGE